MTNSAPVIALALEEITIAFSDSINVLLKVRHRPLTQRWASLSVNSVQDRRDS